MVEQEQKLNWRLECNEEKNYCIFYEDETDEHPQFEMLLDSDEGVIKINHLGRGPGLETESKKVYGFKMKGQKATILSKNLEITF